MTTQTLSADAAPRRRSPQAEDSGQVRVWDPLVRVFHWSLVAAFATAFVVEDDLLGVHVWAGYLILALIAVRLVWGVAGSRHARFTDFVQGPRQVLGYLRQSLRLQAPRHFGHNPLGGVMVVVLLVLVGVTGLSGMALYGAQELSGPLAGLMSTAPPAVGEALEETHEVLANLTLVFIVAHVAGVLFSSFAHRENLIGSMFTGRKRRS